MARKRKLPVCTDSGNAELFAALYRGKVLYDHQRRRWFVWRDHWWTDDSDGEVQRFAKLAARTRLRAAAQIADDHEREQQVKWAVHSESRYGLQAVLSLAQAEASLADDGAGWDGDPWLLGARNGVVDLRTGALRHGKPTDRITLNTTVAFDPLARCERWMQFLNQIFLGDAELVAFVQRAVGYSLTGATREQCLFLCHGGGANGKSTFLETIRHVAGGYGWNLPFSVFELLGRDGIPNDVASLVGKRLVTAIETNEATRLNEARVKALTGSDTVTARMLYREYFSFQPVAKIWLAANHKPVVTDDSHGLWRRIRLIPFLAQFTAAAADNQLMSKLLAESEGILVWAVRGCLDWQRSGLGMPVAIRKATDEYREESDPLAEYLSERCRLHSDASIAAAVLWEDYMGWCQENGELKHMERREFTRRLDSRGLRKVRKGHDRTWTWVGICRERDAAAEHLPVTAVVRSDADVKIQ